MRLQTFALAWVCVGVLIALGGCGTMESSSASTGVGDRHGSLARGVASESEASVAPSAYRSDDEAATSSASGLVSFSQAFPTGNPETSAILLTKSMPKEVRVSTPFHYYLEVKNLSSLDLSNVVVTDELASNLEVDKATVHLERRDNALVWKIGDLAAGETALVKVGGVATEHGAVSGCTRVAYNSGVCAYMEVVEPRLQLSLHAPETVSTCEEISLVYTASNPGTGVARNVTIEHELPVQLVTDDKRRTLQFKIGDLESGASRQVKAIVKAISSGEFPSQATATADGDLRAESGEQTIIARQPRLEVAIRGPAKRFLGREVKYEIEVTNTGDGRAENTSLSSAIPEGARLVRANADAAEKNGAIVWSLGALDPNDAKIVELTLETDAPGELKSEPRARAECADEAKASIVTKMEGIPAILLEVVDAQDPVLVGEETTYEISVTNQGTAPGTGISVRCELEASMEFVSGSGATKSEHSGASVQFAPLRALLPQATATWRVKVRAARESDARFKVSMTSDQIDRPVSETEATHLYE